jgi:hypothetical protein
MKLQLATDLSLPIDAVTQVTLVAGKRGSGKTNTAKRLVEQAIRAGVPVGIIDPADVWWGLKAGRDRSPEGGLAVYVFGGRHQNLPLEPNAGAVLADVLVEQRVSVVMAVREFSNAERARFVTDFAERLIRRNTQPLLLVLEEAHEVIPQNPMREEIRSLGAMLRVIRLGRSSGIGLLEVTQRLAQLHKTATTAADLLFAHRTVGPQDRDALEEWIKYHHGGSYRAQFMEGLPALKTGEAWVWAPDFPEEKPIGLRQLTVLECETFNSHATPKVGVVRSEPKVLAPVDLDRLKVQMAATIERAKAEDPRELRRQIAELRRQLAAKPQPTPAGTPEKVEVPVIGLKQIAALDKLTSKLDSLAMRFEGAASNLREGIGLVQGALIRAIPSDQPTRPFLKRPESRHLPAPLPARTAEPRRAPRGEPGSDVTTDLVKGDRDILTVLAQRGRSMNVRQMAVWAQKAPRTVYNILTHLRQLQCISDNGEGVVAITDAGLRALGAFDLLPRGSELRALYLRTLPKGEATVAGVAFDCFPDPVSVHELAQATGLAERTVYNYLIPLRARCILVGGHRGVKAADELFEE